MPAEVPVLRFYSTFFNPTAFGDRSYAASAGCRSGVQLVVRHAGATRAPAMFSIGTARRSCLNDGYAGSGRSA